MQNTATWDGRISDGAMITGGVALASIGLTVGLDAPIAAPTGVFFGGVSALSKGLQYTTKAVANNLMGCSIVMSTD